MPKRKEIFSEANDEKNKKTRHNFELSEQNEKFFNPHCLQNKNFYYSEEQFSAKNRIIDERSTSEKYRRRKNEDKSTFHFGQRKLLLSEIEFLTLCLNETIERENREKFIFVYAGAAPGIHMPVLMNMFPFIENYILVDPAKFKIDSSKINKNIKYELINECFTDKMAESIRNRYPTHEILFVSDIRTANYRILTRADTELKVEQDMLDQMNWHHILQPFKSMLKFRLPYVGNDKCAKTSVDYLQGKIYLQTWQGKTSSETRLIVDKQASIKSYDCVEYEDKLFRFNTVERVCGYRHHVNAPGIDHCYDCRTEVFILEEYFKIRFKMIEFFNCFLTYLFDLKKIEHVIGEINSNLNADKKRDELTITLNGEQFWYSVSFSEIFYKADLKRLFSRDSIVKPATNNSNSSSDEDDSKEKLELHKKMCKSPHTLQNTKFSQLVKNVNFENFRLLTDDYPQMLKPKFISTDSTTVFYKERSMRLCEIEFLLEACLYLIKEKNVTKNKKIVCFYAGSAASKRLDKLQMMFPFIKFVLYDPKKFDIEQSEMIDIRQECLTENIALDLRKDYDDWIRLFISNIKRTGNFKSIETSKLDREDLSLQKSVHCLLKSHLSMLRFTVPNSSTNEFEYFDGRIFLKPWSHRSSLDTNLIVCENSKPKKYFYKNYKNQLYRFNCVERTLTYEHNVRELGIDFCYDCRCEVYIFELYLNNLDKIFSVLSVGKIRPAFNKVQEMIQNLSIYLNSKNKRIIVQFDKKKYSLLFTDIYYEKKIDDLLNTKTVCAIDKKF
ncbi:hypothetical protein BpHYR1_005028 [Brachionus plicatilis]|uniref:Cap-specific mRNA (nucleoside-2'-O-)-methyltransferase n=1 Tax=Brachionus plicatilis TaxID=10195 RepID=A0A3M7QVG5_BRAPC|nr:hypothetical protein BpHYR1_005028 [Brachionus plicatilis]